MKLLRSNVGKWSRSSLVLATALSLASVAQAQPNPNDTAKGTNPPNWQQGGNGGGGGRGNFQNMTPEQRQVFLQQMQENRLRQQLTNSGVTDNAAQDPIVAFMATQDKARQTLRDRFTKLADALQGNAATDAELSASLGDLRQAVADEKTRRDAALKDLDAKVGYSKKPHLEAVLTVLGLLGDEASFATGGLGGRMGGGRGMGGLGGGGFGGGGLGGGGLNNGAGGGLLGGRRRGNRGLGGNGNNNGPANPGGNGADNGNGGNLQAAAPANPPAAN